MITIFLIAVSLAMDAFAVSITSGITIKRLEMKHAIVIAAFFGVFQAVMPGIGWLIGHGLYTIVEDIDHWVAFVLLSAIGLKMIHESRKIEDIEERPDPLKPLVLLALAVATSIDALAVGLSMSVLHMPVLIAAGVIGTVTFVLSFCGVYIGNRSGPLFEGKMEIVGGLILIGLGIKILVQHLAS